MLSFTRLEEMLGLGQRAGFLGEIQSVVATCSLSCFVGHCV